MVRFWTGNFHSDRGLDLLDEVVEPLEDKLKSVLEDPEAAADPGEPDSDEIVAAVEILTILYKHTPADPPATKAVRKCRDKFLRAWTAHMQAWIKSGESTRPDPRYVEKRRTVIERTFDRLLAVCARADAETGGVRDDLSR